MLLFLDIETTGFTPLTAELLELSAVRFDGEKVLATFDELVHLESESSEIPPIVQRLTGIRAEMLVGKPPLEEIRAKFLENFLKPDDIIVGHNISFDTGFLRGKGFAFENSEIDTYPLSTILLPEEESHSLETMTEKYNLPHEQAHRALGDALANLELWKLLQRVFLEKFPQAFHDRTREILEKSNWSGKKFFLEISEKLAESAGFADPQLRLLPTEQAMSESSASLPLRSDAEKTPADHKLQSAIRANFQAGKKAVWEVFNAAPSELFSLAVEAAVDAAAAGKYKLGISFHSFDTAKARLLMTALRQKYPDLSFLEVLPPEMVLCGSKWQEFLQKEVFSDLETIVALKVAREELRGTHAAPNLKQEEWLVWRELSARFHGQCFEMCSAKNFLPERLWSEHDIFFLPHKLLKSFQGDALLLTGFERAEEIFTMLAERTASSRRLRLAAECLEKAARDRLSFWLDLLDAFFRKGLSALQFAEEIPLDKDFLARKEWREFTQSWQEISTEIRQNSRITPDLLGELDSWDPLLAAPAENELLICRVFPDEELEIVASPIDLNLPAAAFLQTKAKFLALGWPFPKNSSAEWRFSFKIPDTFDCQSIFPLPDVTDRIAVLAPEAPSNQSAKDVSEWLLDFAEHISGNLLVTCSSQKSVEEVEELLAPQCAAKNIRVLSHRSGSTGKIRRFLQQKGQKILLATPTFLDRVFPVENLSFELVLFQKFLFDSPGNSLISARKKLFSNGFEEYILPRSLARFEKEIFRLLQYQATPYSFFCLDPRFTETSGYGRSYRNLLPKSVIVRRIVREEISAFHEK